jgi:amino acid transporter
MSGVTDNAIYPVLFLDYAVSSGGTAAMDPWTRFVTLTAICVSLTYINYRGLNVVGNMSLTICALSMSPFVVFCIVGMFKVDPSRWLQMPAENISVDDDTGLGPLSAVTLGGVMWRPYLNNLFWNLNSFDSAACLAGEVSDPGRSLPRAMLGGTILIVLGYLLPVMVATGATDSAQSDWVDGYMTTIVSEVVGPWLGGWVIFAAGISNLALFQGEMSSDAFQILGLAERGHLPKIFAHRSRYGTPTAGLLVGLTAIIAMSMMDLSSLIEMLNFNYAL